MNSYNKDKEQLGNSVISRIRVIEVQGLDNWWVVLQAHAGNIVSPNPKERKGSPE
jgi:hypothetical protein